VQQRRSVLRHAGVDLPRPAKNAAAHTPDASEARAQQIPHGERASRPTLAIHGDGRLRIELRNGAAQAVQRNQPRTLDTANLPLVRLADIDELNRLAGGAANGELTRLDLWDGIQAGGLASARGAELLIVHKLAKLTRPARRAQGIPPHVYGAELGVQRVHQ